jgi:hypothetical protein
MKLVKTCFVILFLGIFFSACEVQDEWTVNDIVKGTPSNADTVLPHKFKKYQKTDSMHEAHEENLPTVFRR